MNNARRRRWTGPSVASYRAGEEADRLKRTALMQMTLCIYANTPPKPQPFSRREVLAVIFSFGCYVPSCLTEGAPSFSRSKVKICIRASSFDFPSPHA